MDSVSIMGSMLGSVITDRKLRLAEVSTFALLFCFCDYIVAHVTHVMTVYNGNQFLRSVQMICSQVCCFNNRR